MTLYSQQCRVLEPFRYMTCQVLFILHFHIVLLPASRLWCAFIKLGYQHYCLTNGFITIASHKIPQLAPVIDGLLSLNITCISYITIRLLHNTMNHALTPNHKCSSLDYFVTVTCSIISDSTHLSIDITISTRFPTQVYRFSQPVGP